VSSEPGVTGVTFVDRLPRTERPEYEIELSYDSTTPRSGGENARRPFREATVAGIEPSYFDVLQTPILAGRAFNAGDLTSDGKVAIVDQGFIDQVLEGRNPIGQQVRFVGRSDPKDPAPWFEIVGVVKDLGMGTATRRGRAAGFYVLPRRNDSIGST